MKPANPSILTINGGSSSIKFAEYQLGEPLNRSLHGTVDRIGMSGTNLTFQLPGSKSARQPPPRRFRPQIGSDLSERLARRAGWLRIGPGRGTPRGPWHATHRA